MGAQVVRSWVQISWVGRVGLLLLMVHVAGDALLRSVFNQPLPGTLEYVESWYMPAVCLLGIVLAQHRGEQIEAPIVYDRLAPGLQRELSVITAVLTTVVLAAIAVGGAAEAFEQMGRGERTRASQVPIWPARFLVPAGMLAAAAEVVRLLVVGRSDRGASGASSPADAVASQDRP